MNARASIAMAQEPLLHTGKRVAANLVFLSLNADLARRVATMRLASGLHETASVEFTHLHCSQDGVEYSASGIDMKAFADFAGALTMYPPLRKATPVWATITLTGDPGNSDCRVTKLEPRG